MIVASYRSHQKPTTFVFLPKEVPPENLPKNVKDQIFPLEYCADLFLHSPGGNGLMNEAIDAIEAHGFYLLGPDVGTNRRV